MERIAIIVPEKLMPKKDPEHPCPCQDRPVNLKRKQGTVEWFKKEGDAVTEGEVICEGEVEKKALEFTAPCNGVLDEICISGEDMFSMNDVLGYISAGA